MSRSIRAHACVAACLLLGACSTLQGLKNGEINLGGESGGGGGSASGGSESSGNSSSARSGGGTVESRQAEEDKEFDGKCKAWADKVKAGAADIAKTEAKDADAAKEVAERWKKLDNDGRQFCSTSCAWLNEPDPKARKPLCEKGNERRKAMMDDVDKTLDELDRPLRLRLVRAAMDGDPTWARRQLFDVWISDDDKPDEDLRKLGHEVAKKYDATLEKMFKTNGGLGKKDDGKVMCVYSRSPLPAGGKGATGFTTHLDGPGVVHVGCRLQAPANAQNGKILLQFNADTGPADVLLQEVDMGHSGAVGKTDWITGKFTLPQEKFAKSAHYAFGAQVLLRNVFDEQTVLSKSIFYWHK